MKKNSLKKVKKKFFNKIKKIKNCKKIFLKKFQKKKRRKQGEKEKICKKLLEIWQKTEKFQQK